MEGTLEEVVNYMSIAKKNEGGQVHVKDEEIQSHNGKGQCKSYSSEGCICVWLRLMDILFTEEEMANSVIKEEHTQVYSG